MAKLIVEDRTGLIDSNVYASVDEFRTFAELNGMDVEDVDDDQLAIYLVRATNFIDSLEPQMVGKRLNPEQALAFPRQRFNSCSGNPHLYDMRNLVKALFYCVEAQCLGFSLLPINVSKDDIIKKEKIDVLEVQYSEDMLTSVIFGKFPMVERFLSQYLIQSGGTLTVGR